MTAENITLPYIKIRIEEYENCFPFLSFFSIYFESIFFLCEIFHRSRKRTFITYCQLFICGCRLNVTIYITFLLTSFFFHPNSKQILLRPLPVCEMCIFFCYSTLASVVLLFRFLSLCQSYY